MRRAKRVRVFAIKVKEIPDGRECIALREVKTTVVVKKTERSSRKVFQFIRPG